jgi:hypothetical protein
MPKRKDPVYGEKTINESLAMRDLRKPGYGKEPGAPKRPKVAPARSDSSAPFFIQVLTDENDVRNSKSHVIKEGTQFEETASPDLIEKDGKKYFFAAFKNQKSGEFETFKVFILDEIPTTKLEFREKNLLSTDMHDYKFRGEKSGGKNFIGEHGAQYDFYYTTAAELAEKAGKPDMLTNIHTQTVLFKQDTKIKKNGEKLLHNDKNIIEFVAGRLLNLFIGESAATTFFAHKPAGTISDGPDPTGENVYVGSIYYDGFQDLFKDIERVHGRVPSDNMSRPKSAGFLAKSWFTKGLQSEDKQCRYHNLETVTASSLLVGDFDTHSGNLGNIAERAPDAEDKMSFVKDPRTGAIKTDAEGKIGKLVKIDHAGALRNLDDDVKMNAIRFWYTFRGNAKGSTQPTNHIREIPRHLRVSPAFAAELERLSSIDISKVKTNIVESIDQVAKFYGIGPMLQFAERMDANIQKHLASVYGNDDIYNKIKSGGYATAENQPQELKDEIVNFVKDFLQTKMTNRIQSMKALAVDMKISLCFKKVNGEHVINPNSSYNLKQLLSENPAYINNDQFHFRAEGQKHLIYSILLPWKWKNLANVSGKEVLNSIINPNQLKNLAVKTSEQAAVEVLKDSLGKDAIAGNSSQFQVRFYKSKNEKQATPNIPIGVHHMVVSDSTFKNSVYSAKHKKLLPSLSTKARQGPYGLKPGDYGLNFVESNKPGVKGLYIERYTKDLKYQITIHRLPPELNTTYIYRDVILGKLSQELLSSDPSIAKTVQRLTAKMSSDGNTIKARLKPEETKYLSELLVKAGLPASDWVAIQKDMMTAEHEAKTQTVNVEGVDYVIPSQTYLEFAEKQCEAMRLRNGEDTVIEFLADPKFENKEFNVKNPLLVQAYLIVCETKGWAYDNQTNVKPFQRDVLDIAAEKFTIAREANGPSHSMRAR